MRVFLCHNNRISYESTLERLFSKREFPTTEIELNDIAAAANTGCKRIP